MQQLKLASSEILKPTYKKLSMSKRERLSFMQGKVKREPHVVLRSNNLASTSTSAFTACRRELA